MTSFEKDEPIASDESPTADPKDVNARREAQLHKVNTTWDDDDAAIDPATDKYITRKFDKHIVPWLFTLWLLAFIDRSNIGNARIAGMEEALGLYEHRFNIVLAIFYVPYICVDVPSNLILKKLRAGFYLPFLVVSWGVISLCIGFVTSYEGLLAARFFLGLAEGGLLGGIIIYLAMFYRRHQLLYRIGLFYTAAPLSGAFGGLLATGLSQISTADYDGWPFIFFVEGAITIVVAALAARYLPHTPADATRFLNADERATAAIRLQRDARGAVANADVRGERFRVAWLRAALLNVNTLLTSINFFALITPLYSFTLFLPTIVEALGYEEVAIAQLLTVPPNILGAVCVLTAAHFSDRYRFRGPFMLAGAVVGIIGYAMLLGSDQAGVRYAGTYFVAAGIFPCPPLVMGWLTNNLAPHYVRATGTGAQIMIANMAAFIATFTYLEEDAPDYTTGHAINIGMLAFSLLLTIITMMYCRWENAAREAGKRDWRLGQASGVDEEELGFKHPAFRYTL